ncbi:MAG: autotransporter domain-containing protein [Chlamydiia bacterium]|nr:autotransporter domain-containing protein [Chlamydiia bacterium]
MHIELKEFDMLFRSLERLFKSSPLRLLGSLSLSLSLRFCLASMGGRSAASLLFWSVAGADLWASSAAWNTTGSGTWGTAANWSPVTVPDGAGQTATFGSVITQNSVITLASSVTLGSIVFPGFVNFSYTVTPSGGSGFTISGGTQTISHTQGTVTIEAPIAAPAGTFAISSTSTSPLTFSNTLSGSTITFSSTLAAHVTSVSGVISANAMELSGGVLELGSSPLIVNSIQYIGSIGTVRVPSGSLQFTPTELVVSTALAGSVTVHDIGAGASLTIACPIIEDFMNSTIIKQGEGDLTITSPSASSLSVLQLDAGRFISSNTDSLPITLVLSGGTWRAGASMTSFASTICEQPSIIDTQGFNLVCATNIFSPSYFTKIGSGTLSLQYTTNTNSELIISEGTVNITAEDSVGTGAVTLSGGTLQAGSNAITIGSSHPIITTDASSAIDTQSFTTTVTSSISGAGGIRKLGSGTLHLQNTSNSYAALTVNAGVLRIAANGSLGASSSAITLSGGTLQSGTNTITIGAAHTFTTTSALSSIDTQSFTTTVASNISGAGGIHKLGAGTLTLSGTNTFSSALAIDQGIVTGAAANFPALITNGASLIFNQGTDGTYSGQITGAAGILQKQGLGVLTLSGASVAQQVVTVSTGVLAVNETLSATSSISVATGAYLKGTGPIGGIACATRIEGTAQPGNSIGTLQVIGNYTQATGSTLEIEISPTAADLLEISSGAVYIESGATLALIPSAGTYGTNLTYEIVTSTGGFPTGLPFSTITISPDLLDAEVLYRANAIVLLINRAVQPIDPSGNAGHLAACLNTAYAPTGSNLSNLINQLIFSSPSEQTRSLNMMQPSLFTALALAAENSAFRMQDTLARRVRNLLWNCDRAPRIKHIWAEEAVGFSRQASVKDEPGFSTTTPSSALGIDTTFGRKSYLGIMVGYSLDHLRWQGERGNGSIRNFYGAVYGGAKGRKLYFSASALAANGLYKGSRNMEFVGLYETLPPRTASHCNRGFLLDGHAEVGAKFGCTATMRPYLNGDWIFVQERPFSEHGADSLNLDVAQYRATALQYEIGAEFTLHKRLPFGALEPHVQMGWTGEARWQGEKMYANLTGQTCTFLVEGMNPNRSYFSAVAGVTGIFFKKILFVSLDYEGAYGHRYRSNQGSLQAQINF